MSYGTGFVLAKVNEKPGWSAPLPFSVTTGGLGFTIGYSEASAARRQTVGTSALDSVDCLWTNRTSGCAERVHLLLFICDAILSRCRSTHSSFWTRGKRCRSSSRHRQGLALHLATALQASAGATQQKLLCPRCAPATSLSRSRHSRRTVPCFVTVHESNSTILFCNRSASTAT